MKQLEKDYPLLSKLSISRICKTIKEIFETVETNGKGSIVKESDVNKIVLFISLLNAELNVLELYEEKESFKIYIDFVKERHFNGEPRIVFKTFIGRFQFLSE